MEHAVKQLLQKKLSRSDQGSPIFFSNEEVEQLIGVVDDLSKRNVALEIENTALSLFNVVVRHQ